MPVRGQKAKRQQMDARRAEKRKVRDAEQAARNGRKFGKRRGTYASNSSQQSAHP